MNENILCDKISALRRASGMTQEQLAARLGVTYQAVSKWENAQSCPDIMLLPTLAEVFQVSIDQLFGREPAPAPVVAAPPEPGPRVICGALPWTNDGSLHAVLYRGHTLLENKPLSPAEAALCEKVELHVDGDVEGNVSSAYSVSVSGEVGGDVDAGRDVSCGQVSGSVDVGRDLSCGEVYGNVDAGSSVSCGEVSGNVDAGSGVSCGNVGGDVDAGGSVNCGDVGGDVDAGSGVMCSDVGGDVDAGGDIRCGGVSGDVDAGGSVSCTGGIGGDVHAGRDVRCGVEPEEDEDGEKSFRVSGFGKGNHVIFETESDGLDPELSQMIGELTDNARDSAKKAGQISKEIGAMVSKYFEDRFK
ncbi:MAG: helix-turn-helix domain-containing protein [Oscillospiraceae bacterium]